MTLFLGDFSHKVHKTQRRAKIRKGESHRECDVLIRLAGLADGLDTLSRLVGLP